MKSCPHCGAPGSYETSTDGRCPVCGMVLPAEGETEAQVASVAEVENGDSEESETPQVSTLVPGATPRTELATVALHGEDDDEDDGDQSPSGEELIKPRVLSPEYARRVTAAWKQTRSQFNNPQETIKSSKGSETPLSGLNVGSRAVGASGEAGLKDYTLTEIIGEGAMGEVWSARQTSLDRDVAIKMPKGIAASSGEGQRQFMSEVVVTGQLDHPNIVPIYELARDSKGQLFYSMKRVEGRPWNELLEEREKDLHENIEILMKVCDAIRFAHDRGVIHRDIKPHNVMVGSYGEVSMMDWGIAIRLDVDTSLRGAARISPAGTPAYMAPEMATGAAGEIGPATDVYLLGAVLYEILTGGPPHPPPYDSKDNIQIVNDALLIAARNMITPIEDGGELAEIAYKAMATNVDNRFPTVHEFQDAIRDYLSHVESIKLTERGVRLLESARKNGHTNGTQGGRFDDFDRARFALEEAVQIWPENRIARQHLAETVVAYADYAYEEGAYARGIALLSPENPTHLPLLRKLQTAQSRTKNLWMLLRAAMLLMVIGGAAFTYGIYRQWKEAETQREAAVAAQSEAETQREAAVEAKVEAETQREAAVAARNETETQRIAAVEAKVEAETQREAAVAAQNEAETQRLAAVEAKEEAETQREAARSAEREAQRSSYVSEIGLASEELQRNAFDRVEKILDSQAESPVKAPLRNWEWGYLNSLVNLDAASYDDGGVLPRGRVEATAVSGNGEWIASGTRTGDVYVWRSDRSEQPVRLKYGQMVNALAITADGSTILAAGADTEGRHTVKVWSLPARNEAAPSVVLTHKAPILSIDLAPSGDRFVVGTEDGIMKVASIDGSGTPRVIPATGQENSIWSVRYSSDGAWIVSAGEDHTVRVWDSAVAPSRAGTVDEARRFDEHDGAVYAAAFSPDGSYVVSGGEDRRLLAFRFDAAAARRTPHSQRKAVESGLIEDSELPRRGDEIQLGEHDAAIRSVSFAADGHTVFSAGHDHTVRVWDVSQGPDAASLAKTLRGHGGWVRSCVAFPANPDDPQGESKVLSGGYDRRVRLWNWKNYSFPLVLRYENQRNLSEQQLTTSAASADGEWLAAASTGGVITVWDMSNPESPEPQDLSEGHDWQATTGVYFDNGRKLLTAGGDNTALVWDEQHGNELLRLGGWNLDVGAGWRGVAAVDRSGRYIATGAQGDVVARVWDAESGGLVAEVRASESNRRSAGEQPEATAIAFSPDGGLLLWGDQWGTCYLASESDGWKTREFQGHDGKVSAVNFLPGGEGCLTAGADAVVQEWRLSAGRLERNGAYVHDDRVVAMDVSADGQRIITAVGSEDPDAVLRVWKRGEYTKAAQTLSLAQVSEGLTKGEKDPIVRSVTIHAEDPEALVTVFDPDTSTYRVARWAWSESTSPYRFVSNKGLRDVSTAVFSPRGADEILTVGGRGARLQKFGAQTTLVSMTYRPQSAIRSIAFSAGGERLMSVSGDGSVKVWTLDRATRTWRPEVKLVGKHDGPINSVACHPTRDDLFLTASEDGTAKVWRLNDGQWEAERTIEAPGGGDAQMLQAIFVPGPGPELRIATAGTSGAHLWVNGHPPQEIPTDGVICCLAPTPDGKWIAIGEGIRTTFFNTETHEKAHVALEGHSGEITALAFLPDGTRMFTASKDSTVKVWNVEAAMAADEADEEAQRELLTLEGHEEEVTSITVGVHEGAPTVMTTALDGYAIVWPSDGKAE